jgi:hypothetical protein
MLNLLLIVLQSVHPLCEYKVWINTKRGAKAKHHLRNMVQLNMMEEEFHARMMEEPKRAAYFVVQREMDREEYKEKQEEELAQKCEKVRRMLEVVRKRS